MSAGNSPDIVVVLPSNAEAPANYNAASNANVTFIQQEGTSEDDTIADSITIETGTDGRFVIPPDLKSVTSGNGGILDIAVSTDSGMPVHTSLPSAPDDTGQSPMSLMVVPGEFRMLKGESRVFHAIKTTPSGTAVRASNVTWDCDPASSGVMSTVEEASDGSYVICRAESFGAAEVSAYIDAGGGLSDSARGEVLDPASLIKVSGIVNTIDGITVGRGFLVSFIMNSPNRQRPIHFAGHTIDSGQYRVFLPPTPVSKTYHVLIGTPRVIGGRLHEAVPFTYTVTSIDNGTSITGADFTIGAPLPPLRPRPPLARIIRAAWHQAEVGARPRFFEPYHGIRLLLSDAVPDGKGQILHDGMFKGWCYDRQGDMLSITPPALLPLAPPCPNGLAGLRVDIVKSEPYSYKWSKYINIPGIAGFVEIASGDVSDSIIYSVVPENSYISNISSVARHLAPSPLGPVLLTTAWDWDRIIGSDTIDDGAPGLVYLTGRACLGGSQWSGTDPATACGNGFPLLDFSMTRQRSPEFAGFSDTVTGLFTFHGVSTSYHRRPDGKLKQITSEICSDTSPCLIMTDGSGLANVVSFDGAEQVASVSFDIMPFDPEGDIASGKLTLVVRSPDGSGIITLEFQFSIARTGIITVVRPDGAVRNFMLQGA
jgi:hypothetical protein